MAQTNTSNGLSSGSLLEYATRKAIQNYRAASYFKQFASSRGKPMGFGSYSFFAVDDTDVSLANAATTEGVTPNTTTKTISEINVALEEHAIVTEFSAIYLDDAPINIVQEISIDVGENMAEIADKFIQSKIDGGTNVIYCSADVNTDTTAELDSDDTLALSYILEAASRLEGNKAPKIDGGYVGIFHPHQMHDLRKDTTTYGYIEAVKYAAPDKIFNGEVGKVEGVRLVSSPNTDIQTDAGATTTDVYYGYVFGRDAYGFVDNGKDIEMFIVPPTASASDPAAQRAYISGKMRCGATILKQAGIYRLESASSIGNNS